MRRPILGQCRQQQASKTFADLIDTLLAIAGANNGHDRCQTQGARCGPDNAIFACRAALFWGINLLARLLALGHASQELHVLINRSAGGVAADECPLALTLDQTRVSKDFKVM
jgi:hypothetical protein